MSFSEVLKETVGKVDGAVSAMIISSDGMPVTERVDLSLRPQSLK